MVFFDDAHLLPFEKKRAIEGLRDLITRLSPSDRLALLSVGDSARVVVPFTNSKEDLFDGLSRLEKMPPSGLRWDSDFRRTVLEIQRTRRASRESMIRSWAEQSRTREEATLRELRTSVSALAARSGKRALLFISGGLELFPGQSLYQALGTTSLVNQYELSVKDRFSDVIAEANRAGVTIHSIDARGLTTDVDATESQPSPFNSFLRNQNLRESLAGFAAETGGLLVAERNDFPKAFGEIYRQSSSYYLVGVTLSNLDSKKKTHSVSVTTTRPGVTLKTRRSFAAKAASEAARDRMSMALITPDAQGDFPIELAIGAPKKGGGLGRRLSPFELKIPLSQLTFSEENGQKKAAVEISIAAVEDNGAKSDFAPVPQTITVPVDRFEKARKESFLYTGEIKSRKGNMRFVATVRDVATDRVALVSNAVRVD